MMMRWMTLTAALALLGGCAAVPDPLEGDYSESFFPAEATQDSIGARVRWGGTVVETTPEADRTCIEILARDLGTTARPTRSDRDLGRFLACRQQFIDPEIFAHGREVTVVGRLNAFRQGRVGEFEYDYPVVDADSVYLWPDRVDYDPYAYDFRFRHWYAPYYFWPYYRYPFYW